MTARIFLTGASGYIGGEVLYQLSNLPVKHHIRCLARDDEKANQIKSAIPGIETVQGDLADAALIEEEAKTADVVFHLASTRHEVSSRAIVRGLSDTSRTAPGYWLQIGGASMFAGDEIKAKSYGNAGGKTYDDLADIDAIKTVITASPARVVDNLVLQQKPSTVKTALVAGPIIYGRGRGPVNTHTIQGPTIAKYTLEHGQAFQVGRGENVWSTIHVADVAKLFVLLLDAAWKGQDDVWNENGIFLPENGQIAFSEYARLISKAAKDQMLIESDSIKSLTSDEVDQVLAHGAVVLGTNAKLSSSRAQKFLGWQPSGISLAEDVPLMVKGEAERRKSTS